MPALRSYLQLEIAIVHIAMSALFATEIKPVWWLVVYICLLFSTPLTNGSCRPYHNVNDLVSILADYKER